MDRPIERKGKLRKRHIWIGVGVVLILLVAWNLIFGDKSSKLNVYRDKITIEDVTEGDFKNYISVTGTVEPITTIYLDVTEGGRVEKIVAEEGTMVDSGEILVNLSNISLILEISNYEAQVSRITNELRQARLMMDQQTLNSKSQLLTVEYDVIQRRRTYENNKVLYSGDHISKEEFDLSREQLELAEKRLDLLLENLRQDSVFRTVQIASLMNSVNRMQRNLEIVNDRLASLNFSAPVSGELASLNLEIGQVLTRGERIGQINILDSYKLRVEIDEYFISKVQRGLSGECDFSGRLFDGVLTKIYPEVTAGKFYADMGLQVYYLGISVYGWYFWLHGGNPGTNDEKPPVKRITGKLSWMLAAACLLLFLAISAALKYLTDSDVALGDGFTTAASIVATWMLARKILEHWLVWILVDAVAAALYFYKGLYPSTVLYVIYSLIAILGYFQWKRLLLK